MSISLDISNHIRELAKTVVSWPGIIADARRHGVMPLLYRSLRRTSADRVPADIMILLQEECLATAQANLVLTGALRRILASFQDQRMPVIPFKGPLLTAEVYGDLALRRFNDLDILVSPRVVEQARDALASMGYRVIKEHRGWQTSLVDQSGTVCVDLHQRLSPPAFPVAVDVDRLLRRLRPIRLAGRDVATLSREDLLLALCIQLARDAWADKNRLIKLVDVAEIVRELPAASWPALLHEAREARAEGMLVFALRLSQELFGTDLPIGVVESMDRRGSVSALATTTARHFLRPGIATGEPDAVRFDPELRRQLCDGSLYRRQRVRSFVSRALVPSERDRAVVHLPRLVSFLYYGIRPVRLVHDAFVAPRSVDAHARRRWARRAGDGMAVRESTRRSATTPTGPAGREWRG
jgi:hypothetical protein